MVGAAGTGSRHQRRYYCRGLSRAPGGTPRSRGRAAGRMMRLLKKIGQRITDSLFVQTTLLALGQIRGNKLRSGLTVLGVVVGICCVLFIVAIISGLNLS